MASINPVMTRRQMTAVAMFMRSGTTVWKNLGDITQWKLTPDVKRTPIMDSMKGYRLQSRELMTEVAWKYELTSNEVTIDTLNFLHLGSSGSDVVQTLGTGLTASFSTVAFRTWLPLGKESVSSVVVKNASNTITYVAGVDYDVDLGAGLIRLYETGSIAEGVTINVTFNCAATTRKSLTGLSDLYTAGTLQLQAFDQHDERPVETHVVPCQLYISDWGSSDGSKIMEVTFRANASSKPTITQRA